MHKYQVVENRSVEARLVFKDGAGLHHLARPLGMAPPAGATLAGTRPHLGFGLLLCTESGRNYRVIFQVINCASGAFDAGWMAPPPRAWGRAGGEKVSLVPAATAVMR